MKDLIKFYTLWVALIFIISTGVSGQDDNCFLYDFEPKTAVIPQSQDADETTSWPTVIVSLTGDTTGKISKYVFGNAVAAWFGSHTNFQLIENTAIFAPSLIRFPGGSWSNGYFFNGVPTDVPDSIYDGTTYNSGTKTANLIKFYGHDGTEGWVTSTDQYYTFRENTNVNEGLITINYGYARYSTSDDPVAQAAHLAADWVRYDAGRTKFWEIGNENGGPWEYGWMIDTALNKDGQPQIITGELYGKHFKIIADSMRKAAAEIGDTIFIGGQLTIDGENSWNFVDRTWNSGFFKEVGDSADYYLIHCYFHNSNNVENILNGPKELTEFMDFLKADIVAKGAYPKPIAVTEYNMGSGNDEANVSYISGMQAVVCMGELIKNNYGLGARWLLEALFETYGTNLNSPLAEFYYLTLLPDFFGDHAITTTSSNPKITSYASRFISGETGLILVNTGVEDEVVTLRSDTIGVGDKYYIYSFTGGTDNGDFSKNVYINSEGPGTNYWGPYEQLLDINADAYSIDGDMKFVSPGRSVQMIMIEGGTNYVSVDDSVLLTNVDNITEAQDILRCYPNPVRSKAVITYQLQQNESVNLKVIDSQGREVAILVNEYQTAGDHIVEFDASDFKTGVYFYRIEAGKYHDIDKLIILK